MTDQPTGFFWMDVVVRLNAAQAEAFLALMADFRHLLETVSNPEGDVVVLWMNSTYHAGNTDLQKLPDALEKLRAFADEHGGDPTGFYYGAPVAKTNWWDGKNPRFDAYAKDGIKIWKLPVVDGVVQGFTQSVAASTPWGTEPAGYHMDVFEVWRPGGWLPDWFVVFKAATYWLVCLASETQAAP